MKPTKILLFALVFISFIGCTNSSKKVEVMGEDSTFLFPEEEIAVETEKARVVEGADKLDMVEKNMPTTKATPLILATGVFHGDEVEEGVDKLEWIGLFDEGEKLVATKTRISAARVKDVILDGEDEKTGWEINAEKNECILLVYGISTIQLGSFPKTFPESEKGLLSLGESFDLGKVKIEAIGNLQEGGAIEYYSWVAVGEKDGKIVEQVLSGEDSFDDAMYRLISVADLDGDGIPDIVADLTNHYNVSKKVLFLSSLADEGEWYKKVGEFTVVGC